MNSQSNETTPLVHDGQPKRKTLEEAFDVQELATVDHDQPELHEEDPAESSAPIEDVKTIFKPEIERDLEYDHPQTLTWLQSFMGFMVVYGVVIFSLGLNVYEVVLKSKGKNVAKEMAGDYRFNESSVTFYASCLSVVVGVVMCLKDGRMGELFSMKSLKMQGIFVPAALGFSLSQFLGFFGGNFLTFDTIKVLDQTRLLITALVMMLLLSKRYSRATWNSLICITMAAILYGMTPNESGAEKSKEANKSLGLGMVFNIVNGIVISFAGVYSEKFMKKYKATPFYIQKIYLEVPAIFLNLFFIYVVNPNKDKLGAGTPDKFHSPLTQGWATNAYVFPLFFVFFGKAYLQGILVKRMSSVVKSLVAVVATAMAYFFNQIHVEKCMPVNKFFCFAGSLDLQKTLVDLLVFATVMGYIFANRDKDRKKMYRNERDAIHGVKVV